MSQERDDYEDPQGRRRPWTLLQLAILIVAVLLAIPPVLFLLVASLIILAGGMQY